MAAAHVVDPASSVWMRLAAGILPLLEAIPAASGSRPPMADRLCGQQTIVDQARALRTLEDADWVTFDIAREWAPPSQHLVFIHRRAAPAP
jgi:hypothetical protein